MFRFKVFLFLFIHNLTTYITLFYIFLTAYMLKSKKVQNFKYLKDFKNYLS